jgi:hypothetical protein
VSFFLLFIFLLSNLFFLSFVKNMQQMNKVGAFLCQVHKIVNSFCVKQP